MGISRTFTKFFGAFLLLGGFVTAFGFTGPLVPRIVGGALVFFSGVATLSALAQETSERTVGVALLAFLLLTAGANVAPDQPETDANGAESTSGDVTPRTVTPSEYETTEYSFVTEEGEYDNEEDDDVRIYVGDDADYDYGGGCNNDGDPSYDEDNDRDNDGICDEG